MNYDFIKNLLNPISEESPCGIDLDETGELYNLEVLAKGSEETQFSEAEPPDYKEVLSLSKSLLEKSRDLWGVNYLIISLVWIDGLSGAAKGIEFLYELVSLFWNELYPSIDVEDDEPYRLRLAPIGMLFASNSQLVKSITNFNLSNSKRFGSFSYNDISNCIESKNNNELDKFYYSVKDTDDKYIKNIYEQFTSCLVYCEKIEVFINKNTTEAGNTLNTRVIISLLSNIITHLDKGLSKYESAVEKSNIQQSNRELNNRDYADCTIENSSDIIEQLEKICVWYKENEPSSPVPLMLRRAISLIGKSFDEIIEDVACAALPQINELFKLQDNSGRAMKSYHGAERGSYKPQGNEMYKEAPGDYAYNSVENYMHNRTPYGTMDSGVNTPAPPAMPPGNMMPSKDFDADY
jgi:type VI secretion system protein ImpA